jgi:hypothetical protein
MTKQVIPSARTTLPAFLLVVYFGFTILTSRASLWTCLVSPRRPIFVSSPVPSSSRQTKIMSRPSIASSVLVGGHYINRTTLHLTTPRSHWEMFPHNREVPEALLQELSGILLHAGIGTSGQGLDVG